MEQLRGFHEVDSLREQTTHSNTCCKALQLQDWHKNLSRVLDPSPSIGMDLDKSALGVSSQEVEERILEILAKVND